MAHPASDCATGLVLHEETNAILLQVLFLESLERHCCCPWLLRNSLVDVIY
jgi:hypothetical protein